MEFGAIPQQRHRQGNKILPSKAERLRPAAGLAERLYEVGLDRVDSDDGKVIN